MKIIIIGGSAGGASVAARLRRLDESAQIVIIEKNSNLSFATCGSPYYLGNIITERDRLFVVDQEEFSSILNIEVKTNAKVVNIHRHDKSVVVNNLLTNALHEESYDKLVLAPGGVAKRLHVEGEKLPHVFTLRDANDTDAIKAFLSRHDCRRAVVIGAGFIGMEMADNLRNVDLDVSIVDASDQVLNTWDKEMANVAHAHVEAKGVRVFLQTLVTGITEEKVLLSDGRTLEADIVILALGVTPNTWLAKKIGLQLGKHGGIRVNEGMLTSDEHIYALGDAVEIKHKLTQGMTLNPLAGVAHKQARTVADNLCGLHKSYRETQHTAIAKVFDITIALTGSSEKFLQQSQVPYKKSYIQAPSHAGYYPDSHNVLIKLLFAARTGRILGAQVTGVRGVDKRIDVLASAIQHGKTVSDLMDLELAYAPPYSSAKDPVNVAGMVAHNMLWEGYTVLQWDELDALDKSNVVFVDVRSREEYQVSTLPAAINIPLTELRARTGELPRDKTIIVFCRYGKTGYFAFKILKQHGFTSVYNISGGITVINAAKKQFDGAASRQTENVNRPASPNTLQTDIDFEQPSTIASGHCNCGDHGEVIEVNACGLSCPGPMMKLAKTMKKAKPGDVISISATDMGFSGDLKTWCEQNGHTLLAFDNSTTTIKAMLQKA